MPEKDKLLQLLIVEDCEDLRELYCKALQNCHVKAVSDGTFAIKAFAEGYRPDVVLFDFHMPLMDGKQFVSELRKNPDVSHCRTVIISGIDNLAQTAKDLGVDGYIKKPVDLYKLRSEIEKAGLR